MNNIEVKKSDLKEKTQEFLEAVELDKIELAEDLFFKINHHFREIVNEKLFSIIKEVHESLNGFKDDINVVFCKEKSIPDAKESLEYIIKSTESAANKTMDEIEVGLQACTDARKSLEAFNEKIPTLFEGEAQQLALTEVAKSLDTLNQVSGNFQKILEAQGFQDLTGQVIKKLISLFDGFETKFSTLIRLGEESKEIQEKLGIKLPASDASLDKRNQEKPNEPKLTDIQKSNVNQDDVDDLLSELGV